MDRDSSSPGLRDTAMALAATVVDIGHTRLQLAATELEEARLLLARRALVAACALYFTTVALLLVCAWVVLATPSEHRLLALGLLAGLFVALSLGALWRWQAMARAAPPLLGATLTELREDAAALRSAGRS